LETIGVLIGVVAIGLFLERGRIIRLVGKYRKPKPSPTEPGTEKPSAAEKPPEAESTEEDL
jgi:hypothetical protein